MNPSKDKRKDDTENLTYFEAQQEAWFANNCQGKIEDYTEEI